MKIEDQIKEAKRELSMRRSVYARRVSEARMRQEDADHYIMLQLAIIASLVRLKMIDEAEQNRQLDLL